MKRIISLPLTGCMVLSLAACAQPKTPVETNKPIESQTPVETKKPVESETPVKSQKPDENTDGKHNIDVETPDVEFTRMVMIDGNMYKDINQESEIDARCGVMDGKILYSVASGEIPAEDNTSNFGTGFGYQYVDKGRVDILIDDKWMIFMTDQTLQTAEDDPTNIEINPKNLDINTLSAIMTDKLYENDNIMISPLSITMALAMVTNGAKDETRRELEAFIGTNMETYNAFAKEIIARFEADEDNDVSLANAIWVKENKGKIQDAFKKIIEEDYDGEIRMAPMSKETVDEINGWVNDKTKGMISDIINELSPETIAVLVNALYFEAEWDEVYEDYQVAREKFHGFENDVDVDVDVDVDMMSSTESIYYENDKATAFAKPYLFNRYSFIGILPKETGDFKLEDLKLDTLLASETDAFDVETKLPKFEFDFSASLVELLKAMGVEQAFSSENADFSDMIELEGENAYISNIIHKTRIEVFETGTKAAAVTAIIMETCGLEIMEPKEVKEVFLDRPFAFIIMDNTTHTPLFMGKVVNP